MQPDDSSVPPPLPATGISGGIRAIGWVGLGAGAWNLLSHSATFLDLISRSPPAEQSYFSVLVTPGVCVAGAVVAGVVMIASVGLLRGREWGRKAAILALGLLPAALIGWVIHVCVQLSVGKGLTSALIVLPGVAVGLALAIVAASLCIRYFASERVRNMFQ